MLVRMLLSLLLLPPSVCWMKPCQTCTCPMWPTLAPWSSSSKYVATVVEVCDQMSRLKLCPPYVAICVRCDTAILRQMCRLGKQHCTRFPALQMSRHSWGYDTCVKQRRPFLTKATFSALVLSPCLADVACFASLIRYQTCSACCKITYIPDACATIEYAISTPCALDLAISCSNP